MLNESEIVEFRNKVSTAHQRRTFRRPVHWTRYVDGPLDGLRLPSDSPDGRFVGWCHPTERGVALAIYVAGNVSGGVKFLEWAAPGMRASSPRPAQ